jgi:hypothetical protein
MCDAVRFHAIIEDQGFNLESSGNRIVGLDETPRGSHTEGVVDLLDRAQVAERVLFIGPEDVPGCICELGVKESQPCDGDLLSGSPEVIVLFAG